MKLADKKICSGCTACYAICPISAISMQEDHEGFKYPLIDTGRCVKCGRCETVCPVLHQNLPREPIAIYAAVNKDENIRTQSSSGGVFSLFAQGILNEGGIVYGAGWTQDWRVIHKSAENEEELADLRGSKYVQSDLRDVYRQVKRQLQSGRKVLFSGCPCQIAGLKSYLNMTIGESGFDKTQCKPLDEGQKCIDTRDILDHLLCVDLICHSVASPGVFKWFINVISKGRKITEFSFRDKTKSWKTFFLHVFFADSTEYCVPFNDTSYALSWWGGWIARPSCFKCMFKQFRSQSDVSIGDAWGCENFAADMDDNKGMSILFVIKQKNVEKYLLHTEYKQITKQEAVSKNPQVLIPRGHSTFIIEDRRRQRFFTTFNKGGRSAETAIQAILQRPSVGIRICYRLESALRNVLQWAKK